MHRGGGVMLCDVVEEPSSWAKILIWNYGTIVKYKSTKVHCTMEGRVALPSWCGVGNIRYGIFRMEATNGERFSGGKGFRV